MSQNPLLILVVMGATIVGTILGTYQFVSVGKRELVYSVDPIRTTIISAQDGSPVAALWQGKPVSQQVHAVRLAFWNEGGLAIHASEVLTPVTLQGTRVTILDAKVRQSSREAIGLTVDRSQIKEGKLRLAWKVLEQGDGGVIEVFYLGKETSDIRLDGTIEGQKQILPTEFHGSTGLLWLNRFGKWDTSLLVIPIGLILLAMLWLVETLRRAYTEATAPVSVLTLLRTPVAFSLFEAIAILVTCFLASLAAVQLWVILFGSSVTPFGF